jgi:membrane protease YdiL (CAAX protease family)
MQANEYPVSPPAEGRRKPEPIASWPHLAGLLVIGAAVTGLGLLAQRGHAGGAASGQLASHSQAIPIYLTAIVMDWALFYYCWVGVHRRGGSLWSLSGGRWTSWRGVAVDLAIALPFWIVWEGAAYAVATLLGPSSAKSVDSLLPHSLFEILLWSATCVTAGICEEIVFRGYLQRQLHALGGSIAAAVASQGVIFGIFHGYQGWKNVITISVLGILFGLLAAWRKNLRANMIVHAWADFWEGWLKFLVFR